MSFAMSAIMKLIAWYAAIGRPNVFRSCAYLIASSIARLREADRAGGDGRPRVVEGAHGDLEAVAFLAEDPLRRDLDVLEREAAGVARALAEVPSPSCRP